MTKRTASVRAVLIAIILSGSLEAHALNSGYWDLWALQVGIVCFAQNPEYRNTPFGDLLSRSGGRVEYWTEFDQRPSMTCLRSAQWVSDKLCTDVTSLDEKTFQNLSPLYRKHAMELEGLKELLTWASERSRPDAPCPDAGNKPFKLELPPTERDEAKASEYLFCSGVADSLPYARDFSASPREKTPSTEQRRDVKDLQEMQLHFLVAAQYKTDPEFVERQMGKSTQRLNELRRKEPGGSYTLLSNEAERCKILWINEVRALFPRQNK